MLLADHNILITGSAHGIGLALAIKCLSEGATVFMTDVDEDAINTVASNSSHFGQYLQAFTLDITDKVSVERAKRKVAKFGRLDGLVNNAAILDTNDLTSVTEDRWRHVLDVNLTGALRVTKTMLPLLKRSPNPSIVNTLSTQSFFGVPQSVAYASAKGGLFMLTRSMAVDFGLRGIRVNAVAPGFIDTRMALTEDGEHEHKLEDFQTFYIDGGRIPLRRPGKPEDCVGAFVFLLSDLSHYITGQAICVDGGLSATY